LRNSPTRISTMLAALIAIDENVPTGNFNLDTSCTAQEETFHDGKKIIITRWKRCGT